MTTLALLSSDCISYLLEYLHGDSVYSLLGTGTRLLRTKVLYGLES